MQLCPLTLTGSPTLFSVWYIQLLISSCESKLPKTPLFFILALVCWVIWTPDNKKLEEGCNFVSCSIYPRTKVTQQSFLGILWNKRAGIWEWGYIQLSYRTILCEVKVIVPLWNPTLSCELRALLLTISLSPALEFLLISKERGKFFRKNLHQTCKLASWSLSLHLHCFSHFSRHHYPAKEPSHGGTESDTHTYQSSHCYTKIWY